MPTTTPFTIRTHPLPTDPPFILSAFDSALPHLAATGSAAQWGTEPRSTNPKFISRINDLVSAAATASPLSDASSSSAVFVAEVPLPLDAADAEVSALARTDAATGQKWLPVAAVTERAFPAYVSQRPHLEEKVQSIVKGGDFIYLSVMVSDFRTGAVRRGAGAALVGFYEKHGFVVDDTFEVEKEGGRCGRGGC
ncbi:hypothetical protein ACLOAV_006612 [Pseudogymnoascus australis]